MGLETIYRPKTGLHHRLIGCGEVRKVGLNVGFVGRHILGRHLAGSHNAHLLTCQRAQVLGANASHQIIAHIALGEVVVVLRLVVVGHSHQHGIAAVTLRCTIPRNLREVFAHPQIEVVVNVGLSIAQVHLGLLVKGRRSNKIGAYGQLYGRLVTLIGRGNDGEVLRSILRVGRCDGNGLTLGGRERDETLVAGLHTPTDGAVVERIIDVTIERGGHHQRLFARLQLSHTFIQIERRGNGREVTPLLLAQLFDQRTDSLRIPPVVAGQQVVGVIDHLALLIHQAVGGQHRSLVERNGGVGFIRTYNIWLTIHLDIVLVATQPIGRGVGPTCIDRPLGVVAAIDNREGILRLAEVLTVGAVLDIEVAIEEDGTATVAVVEGLLAVETERTPQIETRRGQCIIGRFHMAIFEQNTLGTRQRTHIQTA